ncbi:DUF4282 domain-containing protein [Actinocorallia populi]|uniref:DUF4282 domain-containing protein n=1 Tax=Actinocorallia populi TaxID=2079200 RepID=UPI000D08B877|nr:DUF4282 domain-containing protein [Actinocorallia populi]
MTTPSEQPRFNPQQYGYGPTPPEQPGPPGAQNPPGQQGQQPAQQGQPGQQGQPPSAPRQWQPGPQHTGPQQQVPPGHTGPQPALPQQGHTGPQQAFPPQNRPPGQPGPGQSQGHPVVRKKGFFGALLDTRFDAMVTPMLIRGFYLLSLAVITLISLFLFLGIWGLGGSSPYDDGADWPFYAAIVIAPLFWLFQVLLVRMALEFVINQFKITEELQKIRRNTSGPGR